MKYSDYLKLIAATLTVGDPFICHAISQWKDEYPEHSEKLRKYVKKLLKQEYALRQQEDPSCDYPYAISDLLERKYGYNCDKRAAREALILKLAAYHEVRGN